MTWEVPQNSNLKTDLDPGSRYPGTRCCLGENSSLEHTNLLGSSPQISRFSLCGLAVGGDCWRRLRRISDEEDVLNPSSKPKLDGMQSPNSIF